MTAAKGISIGKGMKEEEYYLALYSGQSERVGLVLVDSWIEM